MTGSRLGSLAVALALCATTALLAAGPVPAVPDARRVKADDDALRVAARIDDFIAAGHQKAGVKPAALAHDAAFLRRVSLDVGGRIPAVNDVRKFLSDRSADKRLHAVNRLLASPAYVNHFTNIWRELLIPEAAADYQARYMLPGLDRWLRDQFKNNVGFDKMVHEIVALPIGPRTDPNRYFYYSGQNQASPMAIYIAKKGKAEDVAAHITRLFLGVRLECAQCHDHPFGKWKREEFWSQAAFFGGLKGTRGDFYGPISEVSDQRELGIPNTDRVAQAKFLDGTTPRWKFKVGARATLADWMTAKDNPFFAKALVNRMWAHFFGVGIVDPVDDLVDDNAPSHPELLAYLAKEFADHDFDLKFLIRAITMSKTYQLSSETDPRNPTELRLFARMPVKGLSAQQMYDSLRQATGLRDNGRMVPGVFFNPGDNQQQFLETFGDQEKRTEYHTSIPQALTMMNNQIITAATHPTNSEVLAAIVASNFMSDRAKVEALTLAALSRKPTSAEAARFGAYVAKGGAARDKKKALADVFWALLNSTEFRFNH